MPAHRGRQCAQLTPLKGAYYPDEIPERSAEAFGRVRDGLAGAKALAPSLDGRGAEAQLSLIQTACRQLRRLYYRAADLRFEEPRDSK